MRNNKRRTLDDADFEGWFTAADTRKSNMTREEMIAAIKRKNSYRWWRLNYDYRWLRKWMKKQGFNPDDARELLP